MEAVDKICARCGEEWPNDEEFYWKPTDKTCRACKYEVKKAQHDRDPNRRKSSEASA
jgi:predicted amidophosphoribosyltransferase